MSDGQATTIAPPAPPDSRAAGVPGTADPLGATWDGSGTNFSVYSEVATGIDLCLFDARGVEARIAMPQRTRYCWTLRLPEIGPGHRYGYRVTGPWDPAHGQRCLPSKLLLDPYARAIDGPIVPHRSWFAYQADGDDLTRDDTDSAPFTPRALVVDPHFDWGEDQPPRRPLDETVIYELHVKGFTKRHPKVPEALRGTYAGLAHPAAIAHLVSLGVTAVELMPVHQFLHDATLVDRGLVNYWGYSSIGFFAPHNAYAASREPGGQVAEFKQLVKALHAAGLEVILDVVFNHTAEGNHLGPTIAFKGFDNATYYRLSPDDPRFYEDFTGTGNSLNLRHPEVVQLVADSLRYWITDMHVDGFRFDLATTLGRMNPDFDRHAPFFDVLHQDPVIATVKLIAEPWDLGPDGYRLGQFPVRWSEWNGRYRDSVRDFWRSEDGVTADFARRLTGSDDLSEAGGRAPTASINLVTAHDGFTLTDLVSYNTKHNEANGEENRDGENHNRSWNCGAEGATDDPVVVALRARQERNLMATLALSHGVPMILAGDELGRTQSGNNNAYCQDNELSWIDWAAADETLTTFVRLLLALRRDRVEFRRARWLADRTTGAPTPDIAWFRADGQPMTDDGWGAKAIALGLGGVVEKRRMMLFFNGHHEAVKFEWPAWLGEGRAHLVVDTGRLPAPDHAAASPARVTRDVTLPGAKPWTMYARSMAVFEVTNAPRAIGRTKR